MGHLITVATCTLVLKLNFFSSNSNSLKPSKNQWALDFDGNFKRILESIELAKKKGARYRLGPELEITGYGCNDHFLEGDTNLHSWEILIKLLTSNICRDILCDVGIPKKFLANDGNYRETRWFSPWLKSREIEDYYLPRIVSAVTEQETVPFGDGIISTDDTVIGTEMCEELFTPDRLTNPHIQMALDGVEIFANASGSHHEFRKLHKRVELLTGATAKSGGVYIYANQQGCDGERVYYDGCSLVCVNGELIAQGSQFSLRDVEVTTATFDIEDVRGFRTRISSRGLQAAGSQSFPRIRANITLSDSLAMSYQKKIIPNPTIQPKYHTPEEEIRLGPACWLWDYMRRSNSGGYFLPLSGGIDSCASALIVFSMCRLVCESVQEGDAQVIMDAKKAVGETNSDYVPKEPTEFS
ncbi:glutamine-dependent NAD(+) synthetase, partial [Nowakowskiella sp. JEL0078]